jgi:hypothetical protein
MCLKATLVVDSFDLAKEWFCFKASDTQSNNAQGHERIKCLRINNPKHF